MSITSQPMLSHVGLFVWDMQKMVNFYVDLFGLKVTDKGRGRTFRNDLVFLSSHPDHHHQLVLSSGRAADATFSTASALTVSLPFTRIRVTLVVFIPGAETET